MTLTTRFRGAGTRRHRAPRTPRLWWWTLAAFPMLCVGIGLGLLVTPSSSTASSPDVSSAPTDGAPTEVDVGFASDMAYHHAQAIAMSQRVLGTDTTGAVQAAAAEILQTQAYEMGMLQGWLREWGATTAPPEEVMGWMHEPFPAELMPGLASDAEMAELARLAGAEKGRRFLELMRAHHIGGIHMAEYAADHAATREVRKAAATMVEVQTYEIALFDELLAAGDS